MRLKFFTVPIFDGEAAAVTRERFLVGRLEIALDRHRVGDRVRALSEPCAAGRGTTTRATVAPRTGTATTPPTRSMTWAFVFPERERTGRRPTRSASWPCLLATETGQTGKGRRSVPRADGFGVGRTPASRFLGRGSA